jgi:undecaprenyl-diphosphatase
MPLYQAILLAIVQGITEFLPISSSAHLALAPWLLGWRDQGLTFDIALHFGTLAAVLLYFYRDWTQILAQGFGLRHGDDQALSRNPRLLWLLAAASVPVGVLGLLFKAAVETTLRSPVVIGVMLIGVGLLMAAAERVSRRDKTIADIGFLDAMLIGCAQAVAIVPGTSRSGITITAALFRHIDRAEAARFSFLLSTPAIAGATAKAFYDLMKAGGIPPDQYMLFFAGITISAITGCAVIAFLLKFLRRHSLRFFVAYRIIFGIIVLALAFSAGKAG